MKILNRPVETFNSWSTAWHGHLHHPPRFNPWTRELDQYEPRYTDIAALNCYGPLGNAPIYDAGDGGSREVYRINLYAWINFNLSEPLAQYLKKYHPEILEQMVRGNKEAFMRTGHQNAIATALNHSILPFAKGFSDEEDGHSLALASEEHLRFQLSAAWNFHRAVFGLDPEGIWVGECAVNSQVLAAIARQGYKFVMLTQSQASGWRHKDGEWQECTNDSPLDTRHVYSWTNGQESLRIFFRDEIVSGQVAFQKITRNGDHFLDSMVSRCEWNGERLLVLCGTDAESYGVHAEDGYKGLARAVDQAVSRKGINVVNYGTALEFMPDNREVGIWENTAWSCCHGIGRWSRHCGCTEGTNPGWNQKWRTPFRRALNLSYRRVLEVWHSFAPAYFSNPEAAIDDYPVLEFGAMSREQFLAKYAKAGLATEEKAEALALLEMRLLAEYSLTSCAFFFEELTRIEGAYVMRFAKKAMDIARKLARKRARRKVLVDEGFLQRTLTIEKDFLAIFGTAQANYDNLTGWQVWERYVLKYKAQRLKEGRVAAAVAAAEDARIVEVEEPAA